MAKEKSASKISNIFQKYQNPLKFLNNCQIENMLSQALRGNDIRLQIAYSLMEKSEPIFNVCLQKRISGVNERNWDITPIEDSDIAKEQADTVKRMFVKCDTRNEDGLTSAIRHLCNASFRGRAATKAFINEDGDLFFKNLENWNFIFINDKPYWNPNAEMTYELTDRLETEKFLAENGIVQIPKDEICYVIEQNPVDWAGIGIYLRCCVANDQWSRCVEKYGIPPIIITAPDGTPETDFDKFNYRA